VTDAAAPRAADPDGPAPSLGLEGADGTFPRATAPDLESATTAAGFPDQRLAAFDASIRAMAAVLSLDRILQVIVDRVRELVGASYAALGIVDAEGVIEEFITSGMSRLDRSRIGAPPRGHGILGLIIRENRSYRLAD